MYMYVQYTVLDFFMGSGLDQPTNEPLLWPRSGLRYMYSHLNNGHGPLPGFKGGKWSSQKERPDNGAHFSPPGLPFVVH